MPELAEVEFYRKQWNPGLGERVCRIHVHPEKRIFRETDPEQLTTKLAGKMLRASEAHGKQMLFRFSGGIWMGLHLGMSGKLFIGSFDHEPSKHDHLVLFGKTAALVFQDTRQFGSVRLHVGSRAPGWWTSLPSQILDCGFSEDRVREVLHRRARSPIKAILLDQQYFPGIGNWMADEILWRAALHPATLGGHIGNAQTAVLHASTQEVAKDALRIIGIDWGNPPDTWLFPHRWKDGGICPRTGKPLVRESIGGRTTCYSPARQRLCRLGLSA